MKQLTAEKATWMMRISNVRCCMPAISAVPQPPQDLIVDQPWQFYFHLEKMPGADAGREREQQGGVKGIRALGSAWVSDSLDFSTPSCLLPSGPMPI